MPSIQIKDVPQDTHAVLRRRAAAAHQSLQEYLRGRLIDEASAPTVEEVLDRAGGRAGGSAPFSEVTEILRERTVLVVDAGALVPALTDDGPDGDAVRDRLRGHALAAPEVIDLEATSVVRRLLQRGDVDARRAGLALSDLVELPLRRASHRPLLARCWELRDNLSVYDAAYVALAELLGVPLVTADSRLARAPGPRCRFDLLE